jgi:hypothetical protein
MGEMATCDNIKARVGEIMVDAHYYEIIFFNPRI